MTNFSVEKWCHLPSPTRYCVCAPACPHWTGGSKEDSILLPALSCSPLFSEGRIVFGPLWTGRKSRAMVCLCVCERGRKATVHFIMHVCFHFHKVSQNPNDCCGLVLNAWLGDPLNFSTLLPKQCLSSGQSQRSVLSVGTTLTRVQTNCFFYFFCFVFFPF